MTKLTVLLLSRKEHPVEQYFPAFSVKQRQKEEKNRAFFVYLFVWCAFYANILVPLNALRLFVKEKCYFEIKT